MMMEEEEEVDEDIPKQKRKKQDNEIQDEGSEDALGDKDVEMDIVAAIQPKQPQRMCIDCSDLDNH